jgi:hypothetical protein
MRYMLLVYSNESELERASEDVLSRVADGHRAVMDETRRAGAFVAAEPLAPTPTATTVRVADGRPVILDGPFAETKEQLAGYYILNCRDLDEAIGWAAKIPTACAGGVGCIEIRPIRYQ